MKTIGKIVTLAIIVSSNIACEELPPPPPTATGNWKTMTIEANLTPFVRDYGNGTLYLSWEGKADCNLIGKVNLYLSVKANEVESKGNIDLKDGYFYLSSGDFQHTMEGTYSGQGYKYKKSGKMVTEGNLNILKGSGKFAHQEASGSFSIEEIYPDSATSTESVIEIRGKLKVPKNGNVP